MARRKPKNSEGTRNKHGVTLEKALDRLLRWGGCE